MLIVHVIDVAWGLVRCLENIEVGKEKISVLVENTYFYSDIIKVLKDEFRKKGFLFPKLV